MKTTRYSMAVVVLAGLLMGAQKQCGGGQAEPCPLADHDQDGEVGDLRVTDGAPASVPHDAYWIDAWQQDCDLLHLTIQSGGGCGEHEFDLYGDGAFMESYPVQTRIWLSHESDDPCDAIIEEDQVFDLTPLRELYLEAYGREDVLIVHFVNASTGVQDFSFEYDLAAE